MSLSDMLAGRRRALAAPTRGGASTTAVEAGARAVVEAAGGVLAFAAAVGSALFAFRFPCALTNRARSAAAIAAAAALSLPEWSRLASRSRARCSMSTKARRASRVMGSAGLARMDGPPASAAASTPGR